MIRNLLLGITLGYRLIPARVRGTWSFGKSTSHLAVDAIRESSTAAGALRAFLKYAIPNVTNFNEVW